MVILAWRTKTLEVDSGKLEPFQNAEFSRDATVKESTQGTQAFAVFKNLKPDNTTLEVQLVAAAGVDVKKEIQEWRALVDGTGARLYLGGEDLLACSMMLVSCPVTDIICGPNGGISTAKLKLSFQQSEPAAGITKKGGGFVPDFSKMTDTQEDLYKYLVNDARTEIRGGGYKSDKTKKNLYKYCLKQTSGIKDTAAKYESAFTPGK